MGDFILKILQCLETFSQHTIASFLDECEKVNRSINIKKCCQMDQYLVTGYSHALDRVLGHYLDNSKFEPIHCSNHFLCGCLLFYDLKTTLKKDKKKSENSFIN